ALWGYWPILVQNRRRSRQREIAFLRVELAHLERRRLLHRRYGPVCRRLQARRRDERSLPDLCDDIHLGRTSRLVGIRHTDQAGSCPWHGMHPGRHVPDGQVERFIEARDTCNSHLGNLRHRCNLWIMSEALVTPGERRPIAARQWKISQQLAALLTRLGVS